MYRFILNFLLCSLLSVAPLFPAQPSQSRVRSTLSPTLDFTHPEQFLRPVGDSETFMVSGYRNQGHRFDYAWRGGKLLTIIPINRAFSTLPADDPLNVALPITSQLQLALFHFPNTEINAIEGFQCGAVFSCCPPVIEISINGKTFPGSRISLPNKRGWQMLRFDFPTRLLELPLANAAGPVTPIEQIVEVELDPGLALGDSCSFYQIAWDIIRIQHAVSPVVFVHGYASGGNIWENFSKFLAARGVPSRFGDFSNGTKPIDVTAKAVADFVRSTEKQYGTEKVNLIAHSKGGLVARRAIDLYLHDEVERLITLGTPHHGILPFESDAATLFCRSKKYDPQECRDSADELVLSRVRQDINYADCLNTTQPVFNWLGLIESTPATRFPELFADWDKCRLKAYPQAGTGYYSVMGRAVEAVSLPPILQWVTIPPSSPDNGLVLESDGAIHIPSGTYPWKANRAPYPSAANVNHVGPYNHIDIYTFQAVWDASLSYLLQPTPPRVYPLQVETAEKVDANPLGIESVVKVQMVGVAAQATQVVTASVHSNEPVRFAAFSPDPIQFSLENPLGQVVNPSNAISPTAYYTMHAGMGFVPGGNSYQFVFVSPLSGTWRLLARAAQTATQVSFLTTVSSTTFLAQQLNRPDGIYTPGSQAVLRAGLASGNQLLKNAVITAAVQMLDTSEQQLVFVDNGAGADAIADDGNYAATFNIPTALSYYPNAQRTHIPYQIFANRGLVSRMGVGQLRVLPDTARLALSSERKSIYVPNVFRGTKLSGYVAEPSVHSLLPTSFISTSSVAIDTNGNGFYDQLVISVPVQIDHPGLIRLEGTLVNKDNGIVARTSITKVVSNAPATISLPLTFEGKIIAQQGVNGTFRLVNIDLYDDGYEAIRLDSRQKGHETALYLAQSFEPPPVELAAITEPDLSALSPPYKGISFGVILKNVQAGYYNWAAQLVNSADGKPIANASGVGHFNASIGATTVNSPTFYLNFAGTEIFTASVNGKLRLSNLVLQPQITSSDTKQRQLFVDEAYTTIRSYSSATFVNSLPILTSTLSVGTLTFLNLAYPNQVVQIPFTQQAGQTLLVRSGLVNSVMPYMILMEIRNLAGVQVADSDTDNVILLPAPATPRPYTLTVNSVSAGQLTVTLTLSNTF